jgi:hypothetical protein
MLSFFDSNAVKIELGRSNGLTKWQPDRETKITDLEEDKMLWTIFVILLVLWLLGMVSGYALGGFIHLLLVLAVIFLIINLVSGRRTVV